jgi:hypothetical protein
MSNKLLLVILFLVAGCQSLVTREDRDMAAAELARLKARALAPESIGIQVRKSGEHTTVRWQERVSPLDPVTVPLQPPDEFGSVQPVVEAQVNDSPVLPLVIDTGAPVNLLHARVAQAHQVRIADPAQLGNIFQGFGGFEPTLYGMIDRLRIGAMQFRNAFTAIRTRTYQRKFLGLVPVFRWEGNLIGMSSLTKLAFLTIDYPARQVTFSTRQLFLEPARPPVARLPFQFESMQILVDLYWESTNHQPAVLDTGSDASIMLPTSLVQRLGYQQLAQRGKPGQYVGLGGEIATRSFTVPKIRLGDVPFTNVVAVTAPNSFPLSVGSGFLKDYRVTIDFRRRVVWLEPGR